MLKIKGTVLANGKPVSVGDVLVMKDIVKVQGEDSFIHVKLSDGSMILQKEGRLKFKILESSIKVCDILSQNVRGSFFCSSAAL